MLAAGLLGTALAVGLMIPLPPGADIYAARRWGMGAGYLGFFLGFPLSLVGVPLAVALHPYPVGDDTEGARIMATMIAAIVGLNWAGWAAFLAFLLRKVRYRRAARPVPTSRPPA